VRVKRSNHLRRNKPGRDKVTDKKLWRNNAMENHLGFAFWDCFYGPLYNSLALFCLGIFIMICI
jgi:hypothetical protein